MTPNPITPSQPEPTSTEREDKTIPQIDLSGLEEETPLIPEEFFKGPPYPVIE